MLALRTENYVLIYKKQENILTATMLAFLVTYNSLGTDV